MTVWTVQIKGQQYDFEVSPPRFALAYDGPNDKDKNKHKKLCLFSVRETQFRNIIWMRIITLSWEWPPIRCTGAFTDAD